MKSIKTTSINVEMNSKKNIPSTVSIEAKGVGIWEGEPNISLSLTSSGTVIVHECKEMFLREDELGEIEH